MTKDIIQQASRKSGKLFQISDTRYQGGQGFENRNQTPSIEEVRDMRTDIRHQVSIK